MLKIEKGIEMPQKQTGKRSNEFEQTAKAMKVGDSVLCPDKSSADRLEYQLRKIGGAAQRKEAKGIRVWRTRKAYQKKGNQDV